MIYKALADAGAIWGAYWARHIQFGAVRRDSRLAPIIEHEERVSEKFDFDKRMAAARDVYQGTHGMTMKRLGEITGFSKQALSRQSRAEGWAKQVKSGMSDEAAAGLQLFEEWREHQAEVTEQLTQAAEENAGEPADMSMADDRSAVAGEIQPADAPTDAVVAAQEELKRRHFREWSIPRGLNAEAVRIRESDPVKSFERAKLAKITAETLDIVQAGERQALGIVKGDAPKGRTVVIERE